MRTNRIVKPYYILATAIALFSLSAKAQLVETSKSKLSETTVTIATDIKTGIQYIITQSGSGLSITPRLCSTTTSSTLGVIQQNGICISNRP